MSVMQQAVTAAEYSTRPALRLADNEIAEHLDTGD
jgi:hypothetical protein